MNADVEKAVEILGQFVRGERNALGNTWGAEMAASKLVEVTQAMRDQEAEIARLREVEEGFCVLRRDFGAVALRSSDSEALLRETLRYLNPRHYSQIIKRIAAHLGAAK